MIKRAGYLLVFVVLLPVVVFSQSDRHYTMFLYNKLAYNPGYTGSRDVTSINGVYRNQWTGIEGAPKTLNASFETLAGSYMKPVRKVALGLSVSNEQAGVEDNTSIRAYYAYRIYFSHSVLSLGLSGGIDLYSAAYSKLALQHQNDPNFANDVRNNMLPNAGAGAYWSGSNFYCGLSVPNLLQNAYDKNEIKISNNIAQQIRGYYLGGGYVYAVNEVIKLEPQVLARYAADKDHRLPFNCDLNLSAIAYDRVLAGITYRTDKSLEAIVHVQVTKNINIGYAYDYMLSGLNGYSGGAHEFIIGYDMVRDDSKFLTPRFIKKF